MKSNFMSGLMGLERPKGKIEILKRVGVISGVIFGVSVLIWVLSGLLVFYIGLPGFFLFHPVFDLGELIFYKLIVLGVCSVVSGFTFVMGRSKIKKIILSLVFYFLTFFVIWLILFVLLLLEVSPLFIIYIF